jgi:hypothetical protein
VPDVDDDAVDNEEEDGEDLFGETLEECVFSCNEPDHVAN